jgi:hypothetical protein
MQKTAEVRIMKFQLIKSESCVGVHLSGGMGVR